MAFTNWHVRPGSPEATASLCRPAYPLPDPAGSCVEPIPPVAALTDFRLSRLSAASIAPPCPSRILRASRGTPGQPRLYDCSTFRQKLCAPWLARFTCRAAQQSPPEIPLPSCSGQVQPGSRPRLVQMNATMPEKPHVGSFVTRTIGALQPNDNPFPAQPARYGAECGSFRMPSRTSERSCRKFGSHHAASWPVQQQAALAQRDFPVM